MEEQHDERDLNLFFVKAPLPMFIIDRDSKVCHLNEAAEKLSRFGEDDSIGHRYGKIFNCAHSFEHSQGCGYGKHCRICTINNTILKTFQSGQSHHSVEADLTFKTDTGETTLWILISTSYIEIPEGDRIILSIDDISGRKLKETALQRSEKQYSSIFRNHHAPMLVINPDNGNIADANPAALSYYGWNLKEMTSKKIQEINTMTNKEVIGEMDKARTEKRNHFYFKHKLANEEIHDVEVYSGPIQFDGKQVLLSIIHDISDQVKAEQEKDKLIKELKQAAKEIKTLSGLIPICSHCKKTRDDKGYWNSLEAFIEKNSDSKFSHGLCPECLEDIYGNKKWFNNRTDKNN